MQRFFRRLKNVFTYIISGEWEELRNRVGFFLRGGYGYEPPQGPIESQHWTIVTPPHGNFVASLILKRLSELGAKVELLSEMPRKFGSGYYIVLAAQAHKRMPPGQQVYIYQLEQTLASDWFSRKYIRRLERCRGVLEYKQSNLGYLSERGVKFPHVHFLPIGGNPELFKSDYFNGSEGVPRPVLFYGAWKANPRRRDILASLTVTPPVIRHDNLFAPELYEYIHSQPDCPVILNIHHYHPAQLETPRLWEAVSLGAIVVSEDSDDQREDPLLDSAIRCVPSGSIDALSKQLASAQLQSLDNQSRKSLIELAYNRFAYYFDRFLLAEGFLSPDDGRTTRQLDTPAKCRDVSRYPQRWVLTLPETPFRYANAEGLPVDRLVMGMRRKPGWQGCALSYKRMARQALDEGLEALWILEDDIDLPKDFEARVVELWNYLSQRDDWDICVGHMTLVEDDLEVQSVIPMREGHLLRVNQFLGMAANLYGKKALEALAAWDPLEGDEYTNTIDQYLKRCNLQTVATWPYLVRHDEVYRSTLWGFTNAHYEETIRSTRRKINDMCGIKEK